jgi:hypothetical protein
MLVGRMGTTGRRGGVPSERRSEEEIEDSSRARVKIHRGAKNEDSSKARTKNYHGMDEDSLGVG